MKAHRRKNRDVSSPARRAAASHSSRSESVKRTVSRLSRDCMGAGGFRASISSGDAVLVIGFGPDRAKLEGLIAAVEEFFGGHQ
jgi:hypothetical protein